MVAQSDGAIPLIQTMLALRAEHRTGVLDVRANVSRTLIHFREGIIVSAEDEDPPPAVGSLLERSRSAIVRALQRHELSSGFDDLPARPRPPGSLDLDLESVVLEVMRALPRARTSDVVLAGKTGQLVVLSGDPKELAARFGMTAPELAVLQKIDGSKTIQELLGSAPEVGVSALLATLALFEKVVLSPSANLVRARSDAEQAFLDGQNALAAGDDETAKKCFYEVRRLDPGSQAATDATHQVRLLARRGTTPPPADALELVEAVEVIEVVEAVKPVDPVIPISAVEPVKPVEAVNVFSERERETEPGRRAEVVRASQKRPAAIPISRPAPVEAPPPPRRSRTGLIAAVLVFGGATAIFATTQTSRTQVTAAPTPSPVHRLTPATAAPSPPPPAAPMVSPVASIGSAEIPEETEAGRTGTVHLPTYAKDRRVYVDGRLEQDGAVSLLLPCGPHVIQIGSRGTPKSIAVLCGREIRLE